MAALDPSVCLLCLVVVTRILMIMSLRGIDNDNRDIDNDNDANNKEKTMTLTTTMTMQTRRIRQHSKKRY
jgi:hypothetical protein